MNYDTDYKFAEIDNLPQLEALNDWALENPSQDIRNRPLVTSSGQALGVIDDMLVDRSCERVAAVRLQDGRIAPAENLDIQADRVVYEPTGATTAYVAQARAADYDTTATTANFNADADDTIAIVEEEVAIGKRAVAGDAVRVTSEVVTDVVSEDIALQSEEVYVTTNSVEREISPAQADALFAEKTIEVAEINEEAVVAKRAVVTGEIEVGKTTETEIETVSETARRTVVDVDTDADIDAEMTLDTRNA